MVLGLLVVGDGAYGEGDGDALGGKGGQESCSEGIAHLVVMVRLAPGADVQVERAVPKTAENDAGSRDVEQLRLLVDNLLDGLFHQCQVTAVVYPQVEVDTAHVGAGQVAHRCFDEHFAGHTHECVVRAAQVDGEQVNGLDGALLAAYLDVVAHLKAAFSHQKDAADEVAERRLRGKANGHTCHTGSPQYADDIHPDGAQCQHQHQRPDDTLERFAYQCQYLGVCLLTENDALEQSLYTISCDPADNDVKGECQPPRPNEGLHLCQHAL